MLHIVPGIMIVLIFLFFSAKYCYNRRKYSQFTIPPGLFFIGNALDMTDTTKMLAVVMEKFKKYGNTLVFQIGPYLVGMATCDYNLVKTLLTSQKNLRKSQNYSFLNRWLGTGLLLTDGKLWQRRRKIITPSFHFEILKNFVPSFENASNRLVEKLSEFQDENIDVAPVLSLCALDIICETAMGIKMNAQQNDDSEYVKAVRTMTKIIIKRTVNPLKILDATYMLTSDFYKEKKALKVLHEYCSLVIRKNMEIMREIDTESSGKKPKLAFLNQLLSYNQKDNLLSINDIRDEVNTFVFEGHDTTTSAIGFALYALADHKIIQDLCVEEQMRIFQDDPKRAASHEDLQNMKYLEKVIKETLRLYPSVPVIGKYTSEDIEHEGKIIPKNTDIAVIIFAIHRDPEFFPDPEVFDPDRFDNTDIPPFAYIPFSAGPRNCIGQKFAVLEIKCILSKILRNFELLPAVPRHKLVLSLETVLKSSNGIKIRMQARNP